MGIAELAAGLGLPFSPEFAPDQRRIEVPVAVDATGKAWVLPALDTSVRIGLGEGGSVGADAPAGPPASETPPAAQPASVAAVAGTSVLVETLELDPQVRAELNRVARDVAAGAGLRGIGVVVFAMTPAAEPGAAPSFTLGALVADRADQLGAVEDVTGVDLQELAASLASGGKLVGPEPTASGYAVAASLLAVDPAAGYAPAPATFTPADVQLIELPSGVGLRSQRVTGLRGGLVAARVSAHARNRAEALARLRRAVSQTTLVIAGGATNRCDLVGLIDDLAASDAHPTLGWLSERASRPQEPSPIAVLVAAVEACEAEHQAGRAAFHATAQRGRPEAPTQEGVVAALRSGGASYRMAVYETAPWTYRIDTGAGPSAMVELKVERRNEYVREVTTGDATHRALVSSEGAATRVEVDGRSELFTRDDGALVRAGWPAFVVSVKVSPGDHVSVGDPLLVLEAMKMESTVSSPYEGVVTSIDVLPNSQVEAGAPLLRIKSDDGGASTDDPGAPRASFESIKGFDLSGRPPCEQVYGVLRNYLLGYELDPATRKATLADQRKLATRLDPDDPNLLHCEDAFIDLFTEVAMLAQRDQAPAVTDVAAQTLPLSSQEYLNAYFQWLDPDRAGLPERMRRRLSRALGRYGVADLRRNPQLESAVVRLFRSLGRLPELVPVVAGIMTRRLEHRRTLIPVADSRLRARFDRLTVATVGRFDNIADMARDVRFRYVEEPLLEAEQAAVQAQAEVLVNLLAADPNRPDRQELIDRLVAFPQPLRAVLLRRRLSQPEPGMVEVLLEVRARRWYRTRDLRDLHFDTRDGHLFCVADYDFEGRRIHLLMTYAPYDQLAGLGDAIAEHLADVDPARQPVIDVMAWRHEGPNGDDLAAQVADAIAGWDVGRPIHRADITVSTVSDDAEETVHNQSFTFRTYVDDEGVAALAEDRFYRNMHPMLAKRLDIWRLGNFELERLPSLEDVFVFHGVARNNPKDHRLFALAEVRDLTPVPRSHGDATGYPKLERTGLQALIAMRQALATFPVRNRPQANRITLFIRPPFVIPPEQFPLLAELLLPLAAGAGLDMLVLRANVPQADGSLKATVFNIEGMRGGVTIREEEPREDPVRPLTAYRQKVLTAARFGVPYPWEILRMFAPEPGTVGRFKPATFVEHDLDESGEKLVPVSREPGLNKSNLVVGLLTTFTDRVPEGMTRVALLSDPTRGLGNLAEPECRIVNAALDLAAQMKVPVEWFAVSSGALISTTSGTENMDWIALTLRRIIEFTQAGGEINIIVTGINVGGQPYWNAEATMLMHTRGILIMLPTSAMVLTGKQALDFSGGVSAEDNFGIGGYDRVMGPNGQAQYWAPSLEAACQLLLEHYEYTYVVPGERFPRRGATNDPTARDIRPAPHAAIPGSDFVAVGDIFSDEKNPDRKKPFDIRSVMRAVSDTDAQPLERWVRWRGGENSVVWDTAVGGIPVCMLGLESRPLARRGFVPADGPPQWTSGTLFPQASRKTARAVNATSGNRPLVVLANLSGFDGSPESMRHWQLEYGAEIGRAVTNFDGPIVFVVVSRYHGGAFVVFSKALNENMQIAAVEGSYASVIGGAPAAATVFAREVRTRVEADPRVIELRKDAAKATGAQAAALAIRLAEVTEQVRSEKLGEAADEFDSIHTINRALEMGSVDEIIKAERLRPWVIEALERGMAKLS